ncbi:MAG: DUF2380 domain-containing protein [Proteobacteria bacterium]|nr:DUF2380 domain-containing protein [Pseudomonadota bacterium]
MPGTLLRCASRPTLRAAAAAALVTLGLAGVVRSQAPPAAPVRIAVFPFELEDGTPASALQGRETSSATTLVKVSAAARQQLQDSGLYAVIDGGTSSAAQVTSKSLRDCEGCEAGIALGLGAQQSLLGIVRRATQTDYYMEIQIRDARTGKLVRVESANFAGSEEGWPSGVRMLIKHQVLVSEDAAPGPSPQ